MKSRPVVASAAYRRCREAHLSGAFAGDLENTRQLIQLPAHHVNCKPRALAYNDPVL
jgi:hypothetical protein